jgi:hypothetical protein
MEVLVVEVGTEEVLQVPVLSDREILEEQLLVE